MRLITSERGNRSAEAASRSGLGTSSSMSSVFFFQAEDGIRDADLTGVQTCALPISSDENAGLAELTVALFGNDQFGEAGIFIGRFVKLFAVDEHDEIRILLDRTRLAQIGKLRLEIGRASCRERV